MLSKSLEKCILNAVKDAKLRNNEVVTIEHLLLAMLEEQICISLLDFCGVDINLLKHQLDNYLSNKLEVFNDENREPTQTVALQRVIQRVYLHLHSSNESEANSGHVLAAMYKEADSYGIFFLKSQNITRLDIIHAMSALNKNPNITKIENLSKESGDFISHLDPSIRTTQKSVLDRYTTNLTTLAKQKKLDKLIGREKELERTILVLCRCRKNNPIFIGEPGVGKTALVEGLAIMGVENKLPPILDDVVIFSLDLGGLLAGTKFRGDFEHRIKSVIKELKSYKNPILFIDEIHTLVGAGATNGSSFDASNILKPFLTSGDLKFIGATTFKEYRNFFNKDSALSRRFQKIEILEPSVSETYQILKGLKSKYEDHYGISYSNVSLKAAAELSSKYIHNKFLPDKAIDVIDEAGAAFLVSKKRKKLKSKTVKNKAEDDNTTKNVIKKIKKSKSKKFTINVLDIEKIVSMIARVPTSKVNINEIETLQSLEFDLKRKIFGQDEAIKQLTASIKRNKAGLKNPDRPIGSFLLTGPTGVGKTEVCKQLSKLMSMHLERFDMSEYMEKHAVSRLIGAPPGYVGFDQGGLLTESITNQPYSILLFDEIEKAHPDIFNILLQIMDYGKLTDNNGIKTDFRNVIIMMTSNVGSIERTSRQVGFKQSPISKENEAIEKMFSPEFRNRLDKTIIFNNLSQEVMKNVVEKFIDELKELLLDKKISIQVNEKARNWLAKYGYSNEYGARPLNRLIQTEITDKLSDEILFGKISNGGSVNIDIINGKIKLIFSSKSKKESAATTMVY